jgi:hypothetical protein
VDAVLKTESSAKAIAALREARHQFEELKRKSLKANQCDMSWVWKEQRAWKPLEAKCTNVTFGKSYSSGAFDFLPIDALASRAAEKVLYWPAVASDDIGSWKGPVYVAVDERTGSAAEAAAAIIQDSHIGKIIGTKTLGCGCGFMGGDSSTTLPKSKLKIRVPNCMRLRADGTDEVDGLHPDITVDVFEGESEVQRAARVLDLLNRDLGRTAVK